MLGSMMLLHVNENRPCYMMPYDKKLKGKNSRTVTRSEKVHHARRTLTSHPALSFLPQLLLM